MAPLPIANPAIVEQFEKDLKFLQLFLLLFNKSSPIKRVDLVWAEDGPPGRVGLRQKHLSTEEALAGPCARLMACDDLPEPTYCYIVNDNGRHEAESCAISDKAAELRVRKTGRPEVYRCHAGLVDIAVPVTCDGQYIATLFTGQVLREAPTAEHFVQIRKEAGALTYINWNNLEDAYMQVPVVSDTDIQRTIEVLEVYAEYLATIWKRFSEAVRDQQRRDRELYLERKEFAHLVLEGNVANPPVLRDLMHRIGLTRYPNRVMVVKFEAEEDYQNSATSFDLAHTRGLQAIDEVCESVQNVCCAYLRNRGVCIFFRDREEQDALSLVAQAFVHKLVHAISARCDLRVRIGVGGAKSNWHYLADSYHEACIAMANSPDPVAVYRTPLAPNEELGLSVGKICRSISERRLIEASVLVAGLPMLVHNEIGDSPEHLTAQRHFFTYALDAITYAARQAGASSDEVSSRQAEGEAGLNRAGGCFELQQAFVSSAESLLGSVRRLYAGRPQKLVERVCRIIDRQLHDKWAAQSISVTKVAAALGISAGHLSRVFKRTTGLTFERYLMTQRVEAAKRMLLEPLATISEVSESCGFSDPAYFARVFRKVLGCSPSEYRNEPMRDVRSA
ncbi:MAG: PocR ligand-binding domain-containing protein [Acidobacteriia bacterium]|nr:PocR ligand-binding domain-containing protein [Terriglobia bacterium]